MSSKEDTSRKQAVHDILAYEEAITVDVEKAVQRLREKAKLVHTEIDRYVNHLITDVKKRFEQEVSRIRGAVEKLGNSGSSLSPRTVTTHRTPRYSSTPRSSDLEVSLNTSGLSGISKVNAEDNAHQYFERKEFKYFNGEISDKLLRKLIGYFTLDDSKPIYFKVVPSTTDSYRQSEVKLVKTFRVGEKSETVHAIATVEEDQAWICCGWGSRNITLYDRNGQKRKSTALEIQVIRFACNQTHVHSMVVTPLV